MNAAPLLIDTHCHFDPEDDAPALLAEAREAGVEVIAVGGSPANNATARASGAPFAVGFDWSCAEAEDPIATAVDALEEAARQHAARLVAIGELGFDFHYAQGPDVAARQRALFEAQAAVARALECPIIVHTREADALTLETLRALALPKAGVIHSYTGGIPFARQLLDLGYSLSFSGIVTFRNADALREVARFVPDDRILVETDSPYLAPVPLRGRRNRPAYVRATADLLAELRGLPPANFAALTTQNARRLFAL